MKSSWFLKGTVRQVLSVPPIPRRKLRDQVRDCIGSVIGPDGGTTKVIETGGVPLLVG